MGNAFCASTILPHNKGYTGSETAPFTKGRSLFGNQNRNTPPGIIGHWDQEGGKFELGYLVTGP